MNAQKTHFIFKKDVVIIFLNEYKTVFFLINLIKLLRYFLTRIAKKMMFAIQTQNAEAMMDQTKNVYAIMIPIGIKLIAV